MGGGKFYVQTVGDQKIASIQQQLGSLSLQEAPVIGAFNPKKGDIVLAQFSADNSWNRAMVSCFLIITFNVMFNPLSYFIGVKHHIDPYTRQKLLSTTQL